MILPEYINGFFFHATFPEKKFEGKLYFNKNNRRVLELEGNVKGFPFFKGDNYILGYEKYTKKKYSLVNVRFNSSDKFAFRYVVNELYIGTSWIDEVSNPLKKRKKSKLSFLRLWFHKFLSNFTSYLFE